MKLLLNTSAPKATLLIVDGDSQTQSEWQADRELAKGLLGWISDRLAAVGKSWQDVDGIAVYRGPGSFTGLRIGITVLNTYAESLKIPIVGGEGEDWEQASLQRLRDGENDQLVLPLYDREAVITKPRK